MYLEDMSIYNYIQDERRPNLYSIGWLEKGHPYTKGETSDIFLDNLWKYTHFAAAHTRGFHVCDLCAERVNQVPILEYKSKKLKVGTAEIRVFGNKGKIYAAPNLLFHYITKHSYQPPLEFVQAVLDGINPYSKEYQDLLAKTTIDWKILYDE